MKVDILKIRRKNPTRRRGLSWAIAALLMASVAGAAEREDFERLQQSYQKRVAELLKPVRADLVRQLTELEIGFSKRAALEAALAIRNARVEFVLSGTETENLALTAPQRVETVRQLLDAWWTGQ